jgi:Na+/melibiose symporter-like transporter
MDARAPRTGQPDGQPGFFRLGMFSTAAIPVAGLATPLSVYLPNYYASHLGLPLAAVGGVFFIVRMIDILFDPAIGVAVNATQTALGRFRPWMIAGTPILAIAVYAIYMAEPGITTGYLIAWLLVLYAGYSILTLGHSAWAAALVPEYHGRSRIYGMMQAVGVFGLVLVLLMPSFASTSSAGIHLMGWFIVASTPITVLLCMAFVGEPKRVESHAAVTLSDYWTMLARPSLLRVLAADLFLALGPAMTGALYLFFFQQALGYTRKQTSLLLVIYIAAGLVGAPFWAVVARRLGKHRTVMLGCVLYGFAQAIVFILPHANMPLMVPGMFMAGFIVSCFSFLIRAMMADVGDEVRLDIGKDRTALLYGLITSTSKVGSTISVGITFSILAFFHFNAKEGAVNVGTPLDVLIACYVVVPVLTMFVGAAMLRGYKLDAAKHDEIRATLAERDLALEGIVENAESLGGPILPPNAEPGLNPGE